MQRPVIPPALVCSMVLALAPTSAHARELHAPVMEGATPAPSVASGPLRIEVEESLDDASFIPGWIHGRHPKLAEEIPVVEGHAQWIAVAIGGATYDYRVTVTAVRDGAPVGGVKAPEVCECNAEALLELVDARIGEELAVLRAAAPPDDEQPNATEDLSGSTQAQGASCTPTDRFRAGPERHIGLAMGVLGAGLLATGVLLAVQTHEIRGVPGALEKRAMRSPGIGLAVGGGVTLAAGMTLLVVDLVRHRQRNVAITPVLDHQQLGIAFTWRAREKVRR